MAYFNICPDCGCHLDPGERCDCEEEAFKRQEFFRKNLIVEPKGQLAFKFDGKESKYAFKTVG